jgi:hypothetical protein
MGQSKDHGARRRSAQEKRHSDSTMPGLMLKDLDPAAVVDSAPPGYSAVTEDISTAGVMRETCPICNQAHLQLVPRQKNVRVAHLFCPHCSRCFDACFPDGSSALA